MTLREQVNGYISVKIENDLLLAGWHGGDKAAIAVSWLDGAFVHAGIQCSTDRTHDRKGQAIQMGRLNMEVLGKEDGLYIVRRRFGE